MIVGTDKLIYTITIERQDPNRVFKYCATILCNGMYSDYVFANTIPGLKWAVKRFVRKHKKSLGKTKVIEDYTIEL